MKFIRKNGRIIPIKEKDDKNKKLKGSERTITHTNSKGQSVKVTVAEKNTTALGRFTSAFKAVAPVAGAVGGVIGAFNVADMASRQGASGKKIALGALAGAVAGAGISAVSWGSGVGALSALLGSRKQTVVKSVETKGIKFKKKKGSSV